MQKRACEILVVGAGIAGCMAAWHLKRMGQEVMLVDAEGIAAGGSGAAGAFISPRIGKGGALMALTNEAFGYAVAFYKRHFAKHFEQTGLLRLPKSADDAANFELYATHLNIPFEIYNEAKIYDLGINAEAPAFFFPDAGVCDAKGLCEAVAEEVVFERFEVARLRRTNSGWIATDTEGDAIEAIKVVLATGYRCTLVEARYMGLKGLWGARIDAVPSKKIPISLHKQLSISAGSTVVRIGATHEKGIVTPIPCIEQSEQELLDKAATVYPDIAFVPIKRYCGMRAGSKDFFPLAGKVVDVPKMLVLYPNLTKGAKANLEYLEDLYFIGGFGGRGFVFAPLMAKWLAELMVEEKAVDERVCPDRLFFKWARKACK